MTPIIMIWGECFHLLLSSMDRGISYRLASASHVAYGISRCHLEIDCVCACVCAHVCVCMCCVYAYIQMYKRDGVNGI